MWILRQTQAELSWTWYWNVPVLIKSWVPDPQKIRKCDSDLIGINFNAIYKLTWWTGCQLLFWEIPVMPFSDQSYCGSDLLVWGITLSVLRVMLHTVTLSSTLVSGTVSDQLPVVRVDLILWNGLAREKVFPATPEVTEFPTADVYVAPTVLDCPLVFPACVVMHAQTHKFGDQADLLDLFLKSSDESIIPSSENISVPVTVGSVTSDHKCNWQIVWRLNLWWKCWFGVFFLFWVTVWRLNLLGYQNHQSDKASNFTSKMIAQVMSEMSVKHQVSSACHPESQGVLERFHQTLKSMLRKYCVESNRSVSEWDEGLPLLLFTILETTQESLEFSLGFWANCERPTASAARDVVCRRIQLSAKHFRQCEFNQVEVAHCFWAGTQFPFRCTL